MGVYVIGVSRVSGIYVAVCVRACACTSVFVREGCVCDRCIECFDLNVMHFVCV